MCAIYLANNKRGAVQGAPLFYCIRFFLYAILSTVIRKGDAMKFFKLLWALCLVAGMMNAATIYLDIAPGAPFKREELKVLLGNRRSNFLNAININGGHKQFRVGTKNLTYASKPLKIVHGRTYTVAGIDALGRAF